DPSSLDMQYLGPDAQQHLVRGDQAKRRRWIAEGFWTPEGPAFQSVVSKMCSIQDVLNLPAEILSNPAVLYQTLVNNFDTPNECGVYPVYMLNPLTDDLDMVYSGGVTMFPSWISEYPYLIWVEVQNKWRPALAYTRAGNQQYDLIATDQWAQPEDVTAYIEEQSLQMVWKNKATLLSALDGCKTTDDYCADLYDKVNSSTPPAN
ncbi:hypothetical protein KKG71_06415, partial [Patescibacteria group bacterium]|nr:hypothetical protein [Patescibacteria group bacterium]